MNHSRLRQPLILQLSFVEPYAELIRRKCLPPLAGSESCPVIDIEGVCHGRCYPARDLGGGGWAVGQIDAVEHWRGAWVRHDDRKQLRMGVCS
jgi:hypothetical protein